MADSNFESVDDYIVAQPAAVQAVLAQVRAAIRAALPKADETISYKMPTYKLHGRPVLYFAGWKQHYSLYPISASLRERFAAELAAFKLEKGTVRLPYAADVPIKLIGAMAKARAKELAAETTGSKTTRTKRG